MDTILLPPDFKEFLKLLNDQHVEYLLIGGYAVGIHGYPRPTADMDIWVAVHPRNAKAIRKTLQQFGFSSVPLKPNAFLAKGQIVRMGIPPFRIEIVTSISGLGFATAFKGRQQVELDGIKVNVINLRHLRRNKRASGRLKDLADLDYLPDPDQPKSP